MAFRAMWGMWGPWGSTWGRAGGADTGRGAWRAKSLPVRMPVCPATTCLPVQLVGMLSCGNSRAGRGGAAPQDRVRVNKLGSGAGRGCPSRPGSGGRVMQWGGVGPPLKYNS